VFPIVFIFQVVNILRGKWMAMSKLSAVFVGLLLLLYFWNFIVTVLLNDVTSGGMSADNLRPYAAATLNQIKNDAAAIASVANAVSKATGLSVSALEVASPMAREMNLLRHLRLSSGSTIASGAF
jgi:hypothetical protein